MLIASVRDNENNRSKRDAEKTPEKQKKHKDRKEQRGEEVIKKESELNDFVVSLS